MLMAVLREAPLSLPADDAVALGTMECAIQFSSRSSRLFSGRAERRKGWSV